MRLEEHQERLRRRRTAPAARRRGSNAAGETLRVAVGADHGGFGLKAQVVALLRELGVLVEDLGTHALEPVDYPDVAVAVARRVASGAVRFGILVDAAGLGSCMAANKVRGVRAATCHDEITARNSREHNDANVLVLGSRVVSRGHARRLVRVWLDTPFAAGRHARRVAKIDALDAERPS
jgi:ribose 5-phosphate isomerase B